MAASHVTKKTLMQSGHGLKNQPNIEREPFPLYTTLTIRKAAF